MAADTTRGAREALARDATVRAAERARDDLGRDGVDPRRLRRYGFESATRDPSVLARHDRRYTLELPFGAIEDQGQTGNCWLFAPVVLARAAAIRSGHITPRESFSETYLYFFNLLEKTSLTLDHVRRFVERGESLDSGTLRRGLSREVMGLSDGGEWEWAFGLVEKYGLVPSRLMPRTASAQATRALGVELRERFGHAARAARRKPERVDAIREQAMRDVIRILVAHLGCPPRHVTRRGRTLSPTAYAVEVAGFHASGWRVVISNPLLPFGKVYERRASAIVAGAAPFNLRRLNVPLRRMRDLVRASLESGHAVGVSADVERNDIDHDRGIMHPAIFDRSRVYGARLIRDLPRREDVYLRVASSRHAMAIVGLDGRGARGRPIKYRVANSWGADRGDHGVYHMYGEWFEENVFKLAVHESVLDARELEAYGQPEPVPGGSFY